MDMDTNSADNLADSMQSVGLNDAETSSATAMQNPDVVMHIALQQTSPDALVRLLQISVPDPAQRYAQAQVEPRAEPCQT